MGRRNDHSRQEIRDMTLKVADKIVAKEGLQINYTPLSPKRSNNVVSPTLAYWHLGRLTLILP